MAIDSWSLVRVYGTWVTHAGLKLAGRYRVTISARLTNSADDLIIPAGIFAQGDLVVAEGVPSLSLLVPATDDPDIQQDDWLVAVEVSFSGDQAPERYVIEVPLADRPTPDGGTGAGVNLRTIALSTQMPPQAAMYGVGRPLGLALLSEDGLAVLDADGNPIESLATSVAKAVAYTITAADHGRAVEIGSPSDLTITLPDNATPGQVTEIVRTGAGQVVIAAAPGVSIFPASGLALRAAWSACTVRARSANSWHIAGDLVDPSAPVGPDPLELAPAYNIPTVTFGALSGSAAPTAALAGTPDVSWWLREKRVGAAEFTGVNGGNTGDLDIENSTRFRYFGFPSAPGLASNAQNYVETQYQPGGSPQSAYWPFGIEFVTNAPVVQLRSQAPTTAPTIGAIFVDQLQVSEAQPAGSGLTAGNGWHVTLTFPDARSRHIRIMNFARGQGRFGGVAVGPGYTVTKPTNAVKRVVVLGDSYVGGAGGVGPADTFARKLGMLIGGRDNTTSVQIITAGIGGTGALTALSGQPTSVFSGRISYILTMSPDALVIAGGRNDTSSGLQAAVESLWTSTASIPTRYWVPTASNSAQAGVRAAINDACVAKGVPYLDVDIDSIEKQGDGVHPTFAGHQTLASAAWAAI